MPEKTGQKLLLLGTTLAYFLIGLEVLFMITPFALYFYGVYGPILKGLSSSPLTAWTTEFFLPHLVFVSDPALIFLSYLQVLFVVGLALFLLGALPLYYGRLTGKGVVTFGPYARIRHPQYLALAISGFGLLLYWPRFMILILYVTMLFVYYLLACNEEWRMKREQPGSYEDYMARTWMFLPCEPGGKIYRLLLGWIRPKWLGLLSLYLLAVSLTCLAALGLRSYSVAQLPEAGVGEVKLVSVYPRPAQELRELYALATESPEVSALLDGEKLDLVYVMPGDFFLTRLLLEEGPRYSESVMQRYPHLREVEKGRHKGGLIKFFRIGYKFFSTIGTSRRVYDLERLVFARTLEHDGATAPPERALAVGVMRTPAVVVDIDSETHEIISVTPASGRNRWGELPMPVL